jgi:thioesterase domain-containing protein
LRFGDRPSLEALLQSKTMLHLDSCDIVRKYRSLPVVRSMSTVPPISDPSLLCELQATLEREIPMCGLMGIRVHDGGARGLTMAMPLDPNRNHQQTAFAGSLNALCTITGWGSVFLLLRELKRTGSIVIRRGSIRYQEPVTSPEILARCLPVSEDARQYFLEMLDDKGQAKLDLTVEVAGADGPAVLFHGSYVVLPNGA